MGGGMGGGLGGPGGGMGAGGGMGGGGMGVPGMGQDSSASVPGQASSQSQLASDEASLIGPGGKAKGRRKRKYDLTDGQTLEHSDGELFAIDDTLDAGPDYGYDRIRLRKHEEVSPYTEDADARYAMDPRKRTCILLAVVLVVLFCVVIVLPDSVYNTNYVNKSLARWLEKLNGNVTNIGRMLTFQAYDGTMTFKVCQYLIVAIAGMALAACGAMFQGALKNAMASPSTLGVMSGGKLGSVLFILFGGDTTVIAGTMTISQYSMQYEGLNIFEYIWAREGQALCALLGSLLVVLCVIGIAYIAGRGKVSKSGLIIAGSVFATVASSAMQLIRYWLSVMGDADQTTAVENISTGTLAQIFVPFDVALIGIPILICLVILMTQRTKMNLLAFTDDEARSMGLSPHKSRILVIGVCTFMTAVVVAFCGGISFVGFMVPHITRKIVGPDFKYLIPGSMLVGAIYCVVTNAFTNMALTGLGMGSITGIIGSVAFIVALLQQRRSGNADWV